ncbi:sensor histidine kinase [Actinophytocola oryzae]|uniref:histidine kinase n=1 Tax=Actinophytocola oryzae TaxID=502181 RepID=A0A4R7VB02_9PSEU|nr:nitrate- and nitrite sensing domain-containing protein [Actinophytocola oryzae]TDV46145.1 signal transduction histidine kinase [Actinophytocola oryzae]
MKAATEPASRSSALLSVLANWRDWNIPVKLAAVTFVPVVFAVVLGTMQISDQVDKASDYRRVDRLVVVNEKLRDLVAELQTERDAAGVLLTTDAGDVPRRLAAEQRDTDHARAEFLRATGRVTLDHEAGAARYADVLTWLDELTDVRRQAAQPGFDASSAVTRYSAVIDALLRFDRTMAAEVMDPTLASTASALYDLEEIKEEVSFQQSVIAVGIARGSLAGPEVDSVAASVGRQADRLADFFSVAGASRSQLYDDYVSGTGIAGRNNIAAAVAGLPGGDPVPATAQAWQDSSELTVNRIGQVAGVLGQDLHDRSTTLQDEASDGAGLAAVILLVALVVAMAVMFVVGRHLLWSLASLRRGALDVAEKALPDAVSRIRDRGEEAGDIELAPMPVTSMDEVGQVARAFDAVQSQALRLATEQAGLRAKYSGVFVNLSRRSQGLVQRQLQLLERLERDEEDPEQLATLFQLDHLATRMRRNNENLMVLSGGEVGRRSQRPTALADLLRASVSEIEQYQRVVLQPPPSVDVVGYAVGDLVRLVAELLDNATAFSAPDTQVTIASHVFEDGTLCVVVHDDGIGMNAEELEEANEKLAEAGAVDVSTTRRMGLFVVGRLAGRHGIEVRLSSGGHDGRGVQATVTVPHEVVIPTNRPAEPERTRPPRNGRGPNGGHPGGRSQGGTSMLAPFSLGNQANGIRANGDTGLSNKHTNGLIKSGLTPSPLPRPDRPPAPERGENDGGHLPLPRRSPGGKVPAERPPDSQRGLFTPARPAEGTGFRTDRAAIEETTPIFDEMVSAWFRAVSGAPLMPDRALPPPPGGPRHSVRQAGETRKPPEHQPPSKDESRNGVEAWNFAADTGFDAARAVSKVEPSTYTSGGLPRRSPRQHLLPGSAAPGTVAGRPRHERDADVVRNRLSDYRKGVRKARDHRHGVEPPSTPRAAPVTPSRLSSADTQRLDMPVGGWRFAADLGWQAANQASTSTPVDYTSGGLPRRSPRQNLVPGSVSHSGNGNGAAPPPARRAEEMRGRLGSFQKGLSRGRRNLADRATTGAHDYPQQQENE